MATERMSINKTLHKNPRAATGERRKPLRTLQELADEFGISAMSLGNRLRHDKDGPKPRFNSKNSLGPLQTWYDPQQVREWYKQRYKA